MAQLPSIEELGTPDLKVAGLRLWVHGRQFPDVMDAMDDNWLHVTGSCEALGARVLVDGHILEVTDMLRWGQQCALLLKGKVDKAALDTIEPGLSALIDSPDALGHLRLRVEITPDHLQQQHIFDFEIDQSYLPGLIKQCEQIVRKYPVRGERISDV